MVRQRVYGLALGREDRNDHGALRQDVVMQTAVGVGREVARIGTGLDATDNPLYGQQEGRFFHGKYDSYCYLPLTCSAANSCCAHPCISA